MTLSQRPFAIRTLQQVKPEKFQEASAEGLRLTWEEAKVYKTQHNMEGDLGGLVDRAQEDYVTDIGYGEATSELGKQYAEWSATAA
eukprot:2886511-Karenia_brevis.AAC.1